MDTMNWLKQTSAEGTLPIIVSEYLLNDLGIFTKSERRMPKKAPFTALTGFRVGYTAVPNTDYRMAPMSRNAILWHKVTSVSADRASLITVHGNSKDVIAINCTADNHNAVMQFINIKRQLHPVVIDEDYAAASWICWRDDDEWNDASASLSDMVQEELDTERFLEPEVLEETVITGYVQDIASVASPVMAPVNTQVGVPQPAPVIIPAVPTGASHVVPSVAAPSSPAARPKFCSKCGELLPLDGSFCENCGTSIVGF